MSKELSPLGWLNYYKNKLQSSSQTFRPNGFDIIETALKGIEIIKDKRVNLEYLKCCETYRQYCLVCSYGNEITQEEFDLLKEVLENV